MAYDNFRSLPNYPKFTTTRGAVTSRAKYTATTAGAIGTTEAAGADFTCTKDAGTTGKYDLTYPPCVDIDLTFDIVSAASTVNNAVITAKSPSAGTASILMAKGGTAAYMASGDVLTVRHNASTEI